jgi:WW domain
MSIIDQPPNQQPSYGLGASQGYAPAPAQQPQQQPPAGGLPSGWSVHYTPDQRPYYFNASTGQSSWSMP